MLLSKRKYLKIFKLLIKRHHYLLEIQTHVLISEAHTLD